MSMNDEIPDIESQDTDLLSGNKVDQNKVDNDTNRKQIATKIDSRNQVDYTFIGTGEESFTNPLGRLPSVINIAGQDSAANIYINVFKSTKNKLFATSSVAGTKARFVLA